MLTHDFCKKHLNKNEQLYNDKQVKEITQQLYKLATLEYQLLKSLNKKKDGECNFIRKNQ